MACGCCIAVLGWAVVTYIVLRLLICIYNIIYPYYLARPKNLLVLAGAKWAVVTGSTDGIGKAYAFELARRGFNIMLISRSQTKLDDVKEKIEKETHVEVRTLEFDFTCTDVDEYEKKLFTPLREIDIGLLVNNVGLSFEYPEVIHKVDGGMKRLAEIDIINTLPPTLMSAFVMGPMLERNSGIIVNISSSAQYNLMKMWSVYSAAKKYVSWLSGIMQRDFARTDVIIQTVCPGLVTTKMSKLTRTSFFTAAPDSFAKSAVNTIGHVSETTGFITHQLQAEFLIHAPRVIVDLVVDGHVLATHRRAVAKKLREAKKQ